MYRMYRVNPQTSGAEANELASGANTSIRLSTEARDELRRYKADDGLTYSEAIIQLLTDAGWFNGETNGETSE
jgi:hypothetical protein